MDEEVIRLVEELDVLIQEVTDKHLEDKITRAMMNLVLTIQKPILEKYYAEASS